MSPIKTIRTKNIQSHKNVSIELPEKGLVVFVGENSHGKSVIDKVLMDLISGAIKTKSVRKSDLSRETAEGSFEITKYDGTSLYLNLNIEAASTWVRLTRSNGETVKRYLSDKNICDLVEEFGFHYNKERGISLHVSEAESALLFFKTNHVTNGDILSPAVEDRDAQVRIEHLEEQYQEAMCMRNTAADNIRVATTAKESIRLYDIGTEEKLRDECLKCATVLSHFYKPDIQKLPVVPHALIVDVHRPKYVELPEVPTLLVIEVPKLRLRDIKVPPLVEVHAPKMKSLTPIWNDLQAVKRGVCPECQRPYLID